MGDHGNDTTKDGKDDHGKESKDGANYDEYCQKYDKDADKCNAEEKCSFYEAKDDDKKEGGDGKDKDYDGKDKDHDHDGKDKDYDGKDKDYKYEYKRGTGCYAKKYKRRLKGHGDHGEGDDHGKEDHGKDTTKDGKDDHGKESKDGANYDEYCMKYDKDADKCNAEEKCSFYEAKDDDKKEGGD